MAHYYIRNGYYYYQRRVPLDLRKFYSGSNIKISLKTKDPSIAALFVAKLDRQYDAEFAQRRLNPDAEISQRDRELMAEHALKDISDVLGINFKSGETEAGFANDTTDEDGRPILEEVVGKLDVLTDYVIDKYDGQGASSEALGKAIIDVAKSGRTYFLSDVRGMYAQRKAGTREEHDIRRDWGLLIEHLGEDIPVQNLRRHHATSFRDSLRGKARKSDHSYVTSGASGRVLRCTARRSTVSFDNVFKDVDLSGIGAAPVERKPLSPAQAADLIDKLTKRNDQNDLDRILLLLLATGARLGEIVGVRLEDVREDVAAGITSLNITGHEKRRLKNKGSEREVPVVLFGLTALKAQVDQAQASKSDYLFPRYNKTEKTNSNSASAAVNKRMKALGFKEFSAHNLRHTVKRLMRDAGVPQDLRDAVQGHGGQSVAETYGRGVALGRLERALMGALENLVI